MTGTVQAFFFFNWRIIVLQCVDFCCTAMATLESRSEFRNDQPVRAALILVGGGGWRWGKRVSGRGTLRPPPAVIKPAFPASPILKITPGFLFKDKEACNSIIG